MDSGSRENVLLPVRRGVHFGCVRLFMRWAMAAFYIGAGIIHIRMPDPFLAITPDWVPFAPQVIFATGCCEIAGALALVSRPLRRPAGVALALYALCVWPANFKHAFDAVDISGLPSSWWYHAPRLAAQPLLIWWALFSADLVNWPFSK